MEHRPQLVKLLRLLTIRSAIAWEVP